jgi:hypothetical protein
MQRLPGPDMELVKCEMSGLPQASGAEAGMLPICW